MRQFALEWPQGPIVQVPLGQISWYHHIALLEKLSSKDLRCWYAQMAAEQGWSRNVLVEQIEGRLHERQGRALSNFARTLPPGESELAQQLSKSQYLFEWLGLSERASEARALPEDLRRQLPSPERIAAELDGERERGSARRRSG